MIQPIYIFLIILIIIVFSIGFYLEANGELCENMKGDFDKDCIDNYSDKCPLEPETYNDYLDLDGCPDETSLEPYGKQVWNHKRGFYNVIVYETDNVSLHCSLNNIACHKEVGFLDKPSQHYVFIQIGHADDYVPAGCTILQHELYHAMGYTEQMIMHFFECGVESKYLTLPLVGH